MLRDRRFIFLTIMVTEWSMELREDVVEVVRRNADLASQITAYLEGS